MNNKKVEDALLERLGFKDISGIERVHLINKIKAEYPLMLVAMEFKLEEEENPKYKKCTKCGTVITPNLLRCACGKFNISLYF